MSLPKRDFGSLTRPAALRPSTPSNEDGLTKIEVGAVADCLAHQIDEIRKLNRRMELTNIELQAHNRQLREQGNTLNARESQLRAENARLQAQLDALQVKVASLRFRLVDRVSNRIGQYPLIHWAARGSVRRLVAVARALRYVKRKAIG
jgi:septal ring factor EnvC (AmiA/AmiB activator)